jgi:hypothetical protein
MLEKELKYFEDHKEELLKHYENQFVLIKDDQFIGAFTTEAEAYAAGVQRFGNQPFLIKKVTSEDEVVPRKIALDPRYLEEIQQALELMKRVRMVQAVQSGEVWEPTSYNKYVLPEPITFPVSPSAHIK